MGALYKSLHFRMEVRYMFERDFQLRVAWHKIRGASHEGG
jgi:hypothetical protein